MSPEKISSGQASPLAMIRDAGSQAKHQQGRVASANSKAQRSTQASELPRTQSWKQEQEPGHRREENLRKCRSESSFQLAGDSTSQHPHWLSERGSNASKFSSSGRSYLSSSESFRKPLPSSEGLGQGEGGADMVLSWGQELIDDVAHSFWEMGSLFAPTTLNPVEDFGKLSSSPEPSQPPSRPSPQSPRASSDMAPGSEEADSSSLCSSSLVDDTGRTSPIASTVSRPSSLDSESMKKSIKSSLRQGTHSSRKAREHKYREQQKPDYERPHVTFGRVAPKMEKLAQSSQSQSFSGFTARHQLTATPKPAVSPLVDLSKHLSSCRCSYCLPKHDKPETRKAPPPAVPARGLASDPRSHLF